MATRSVWEKRVERWKSLLRFNPVDGNKPIIDPPGLWQCLSVMLAYPLGDPRLVRSCADQEFQPFPDGVGART